MCSYNRINDVYGCGERPRCSTRSCASSSASPGFVPSDWGATHRITDLIYGLDMEQPGNAAGTSSFAARH